jgi:transcriptional regulator with XRE-family HTH domain
MALSDNIRAARARLGWSQEEFAERIGVSQQAVSTYENGKMPPLKKLMRISKETGVSVEDLLNGERQQDRSPCNPESLPA